MSSDSVDHLLKQLALLLIPAGRVLDDHLKPLLLELRNPLRGNGARIGFGVRPGVRFLHTSARTIAACEEVVLTLDAPCLNLSLMVNAEWEELVEGLLKLCMRQACDQSFDRAHCIRFRIDGGGVCVLRRSLWDTNAGNRSRDTDDDALLSADNEVPVLRQNPSPT